MFDRGGVRAASSEAARRRLELLSASLASGPDRDPVHTPEVTSQAEPVASPVRTGPGRHAARPLPRAARLGAGVADRVPVPVRAAWSTRVSGTHLAVVALVVATALCVAAWWALSARPQVQAMPTMTTPAPVEPPATEQAASASTTAPAAAPSAGPAATPPAASATAAAGEVVVVDVAGKVRRPGIVTLALGSRVADALAAAGGPRGDADLTSLNLARLLVDGEQLLVGVEAAVPPVVTPGVTAGPSPTVLVDLNTATEVELDTLPGVGPVTAQAILDWRTEHGGFTSVDELLEVSGIGEVTLEELRPLVTV